MKKIIKENKVLIVSIVSIIFLFVIYLTLLQPNKKTLPIVQKSNLSIVDSSYSIENTEVVSLKTFKSKNIYNKNCKFCHGNSGKGDGVKARLQPEICPFDLTKESKPDKFIYYVILNGNNKMPSHNKLNDDKIQMLVIYIKKFRNVEN